MEEEAQGHAGTCCPFAVVGRRGKRGRGLKLLTPGGTRAVQSRPSAALQLVRHPVSPWEPPSPRQWGPGGARPSAGLWAKCPAGPRPATLGERSTVCPFVGLGG